jgi:hypothetical protein
LCRSVFGGGNRPFVVAVWSSHAAVMALIGEAVIDGLSVCGGILSDPIPQLQPSCAAFARLRFTVTPRYRLRARMRNPGPSRRDRSRFECLSNSAL